MILVQDTNVFVAALRSGAGASRELLLRLLRRQHDPIMGIKLWYEYSELAGRAEVWPANAPDAEQRQRYVASFAAVCLFVNVPSLWRPNLPDEGDNHVMELALHGHAAAIVTFNLKDFRAAQFAPSGLEILKPANFIKKYAL